MNWIREKELSVLFRVAIFFKKHLFYFHTHSYQPQIFQHGIVLQPLLHIHRQFLLRARESHQENVTWAFWKQVTSTKRESGNLSNQLQCRGQVLQHQKMIPRAILLSLSRTLIMLSTTTRFSYFCNSTCSVECKCKSSISSGQPFFTSSPFLLLLHSSVGVNHAFLKLLNTDLRLCGQVAIFHAYLEV